MRKKILFFLAALLLLGLTACGKPASAGPVISNGGSVTNALVPPVLGSGRFDMNAEATGTTAVGKILLWDRGDGLLGIRIMADLRIGRNDFGGAAFSLPAGCSLDRVVCTYPETDGVPADEPPVNVWTTFSKHEKYTTVIEIGRKRADQTPDGGGVGMALIEAVYPLDQSDSVDALVFGIECGAKLENGNVSWGVRYEEIRVEVRPAAEPGA